MLFAGSMLLMTVIIPIQSLEKIVLIKTHILTFSSLLKNMRDGLISIIVMVSIT